MAFTVYYDENLQCIVGYFVGRLDLESSRAYVTAVSEMIAERRATCFLSDLRDAEVSFSTAQIYDLPETLEALGFHHGIRRAILVRQRTPDLSFLETTAMNRGYQIRIFDRPEAATDWLHEKAAPWPAP
jgi:hypothetical protein